MSKEKKFIDKLAKALRSNDAKSMREMNKAFVAMFPPRIQARMRKPPRKRE